MELTVQFDIKYTNSLIDFSPDPKLAGCVTQPPVALAAHYQHFHLGGFIQNDHLHIIDNGKGHDKYGNK